MVFRKRIYHGFEELQGDLDAFLKEENTERSHQGPLVLRQDADADVSRQRTVGEGEAAGAAGDRQLEWSGHQATRKERNCQVKC